MKYRLLQYRPTAPRDVRFRSISEVKQVHCAHYHETYKGEVDAVNDEVALYDLFRRFNIDHPDDFRSYSMSVGDIVVLDGARSYYCDSVGWHMLLPDEIIKNDERKNA